MRQDKTDFREDANRACLDQAAYIFHIYRPDIVWKNIACTDETAHAISSEHAQFANTGILFLFYHDMAHT